MLTSCFHRLVLVVLVCLLLVMRTPVAGQSDFYAFNEFLGICPLSTTLTDVSKNGSYVASVKNPLAFGKICPNVDKDTRVVIHRLDSDHWEAILRNNRIQFRCRDLGYSRQNGAGFVFARQCGSCPEEIASASVPEQMAASGAEPSNFIIFDLDASRVKPVFHPLLDDMVNELKQNPEAVLELQGHTCALGTEQHNEKLSEKRANAVRRYLMEKGIDPNRIETRAFGDAIPAASNSSPVGRVQNRRVEFKFKSKHSTQPPTASAI